MKTEACWRAELSPSLRMPPVCVLNGQQAITLTRFVFYSRTVYLPGLLGWYINLTNPPVTMHLPVSASGLARLRTQQALAYGAAAVAVTAAIMAVVMFGVDTTRWHLAFPLIVTAAAIAVSLLATRIIRFVGSDVYQGWVWLVDAHPDFLKAFCRVNVPGVILVRGPRTDWFRRPHRPPPTTGARV
jgi:hypothetical protein